MTTTATTPARGPITVGFDGSPDSRRAALWAAGVAAALGDVPLHLVHALSLPAVPPDFWQLRVDELFDRHEAAMRAELEQERAELAARGARVEVFVRRWLPLETLLEHARDHASGLVVLGQHGTRGSRLLVGSVSEAVARQARMPVVIDRGRESAAPPRTVLLAWDGSPACRHAAAAVARWFPAAAVRLLHVRHDDAPAAPAELTRLAAEAGLAPGRLEVRIAEGDVAEALLDLAAADEVDLVAAGRRGHSAWSDLLLGGVSSKLIQLSPRPVLVAH
jgi:nucleotide-binding universal stress UspA family protein